MEYPAHESRYSNKGCAVAMVLSVIGIFVCAVAIYIAADVSCVRDANTWLVDYPGAELVSEEYTFLRPFGIGVTTRILYTPDPQTQVGMWYRSRDREINVEQGLSRNIGVAQMRWTASPATDRDGTIIRLYSECAPTFVFGVGGPEEN